VPIVSLATFQLAGRGRGSNTWLSPSGCLQFSVLVRVPLAAALPASRLVFVQYLVGLAVVRACRDPRALGAERGARVRLKWPNDVYLDLASESESRAGPEKKKKVGGILVNTSFSDGNVDVVAGGSRLCAILIFFFGSAPTIYIADSCVGSIKAAVSTCAHRRR